MKPADSMNQTRMTCFQVKTHSQLTFVDFTEKLYYREKAIKEDNFFQKNLKN